VALERAWLASPVGVEVEAEVLRGLDPRHDAGHVVEVELASGAEAVDHLLQPGGAALGVGSDDDVGRSRPERESRGIALVRDERRHALEQLGE